MKRIIFTTASIILLAGIGLVFRNQMSLLGSTAYAVGDLIVDWDVPSGTTIFDVSNMAPGDVEEHTVEVTNEGTSDAQVAVKGVKEQETGNLGNVLEITISENGTVLYGPVTLTQFFADSSTENGIELSEIEDGGTANYTFRVEFLSSAGNEYQGKTIVFDSVIGEITDSDGGDGDGGGIDIDISGTGAGSNNSVIVNIGRTVRIVQNNTTSFFNNIFSTSNTGGNNSSGSVRSRIRSGNSNSIIQIFNSSGSNVIRRNR